ncbi:MAG: hypothetical protein H0V45_15275 [Actinobacteria bacterium]|nr:hypothetical protein [Actinomycetota bacterium]
MPDEWADARLALEVPGAAQHAQAAALLGPANPGRAGAELRFAAQRGGSGVGPEAVRRLLRRLDAEGITGELRLVASTEAERPPEVERTGLAGQWQAALATLPPDWSDLYCELELLSTDYLQRAALLVAPVNPARNPGKTSFRFRVARRFGYGASPEMTRRCLERLDAEGIEGRATILRALSDTHNVATQGPVWYLEGKAV